MIKNEFARIIVIDGFQVLVEKAFVATGEVEEEEIYLHQVKLKLRLNSGFQTTQALDFETKEARDKYFDGTSIYSVKRELFENLKKDILDKTPFSNLDEMMESFESADEEETGEAYKAIEL